MEKPNREQVPKEQRAVGFIGLGQMGQPMAKHLLGSGYSLQVYDALKEPTVELKKDGAYVAETVANLSSSCSYIAICVRDENDVEAVLYGQDGVFHNTQPNSLIVIHSTVTEEKLMQWYNEAKKRQLELLDAPMTGGVQAAQSGTLCYMVGGSDDALDRCRPLLQTSAQAIIHAGPVATGMALKLCNNLITYHQFAAISEASRLAKACGLSSESLREVGKHNGVVSEQMQQFISGRDALEASGDAQLMEQFMGGPGNLGEKDLRCALATAQRHAISLPATERLQTMIRDIFLAKA